MSHHYHHDTEGEDDEITHFHRPSTARAVDSIPIRNNQQNEDEHQNDDHSNDSASSLPAIGGIMSSISLSNHADSMNGEDDDEDVLQPDHCNYINDRNHDLPDDPEDELDSLDDDDDDDMTVIPLTPVTRIHASLTNPTFLPPPPPPMLNTMDWLEQPTADMEQLRRRIIHVTLARVQRNAALTMACLCLVPVLLALVILVAARELAGPASRCHDEMVVAMNSTCRRLPRTFLNAFASQCVCDGVAVTATRPQINGREL